MQMIKNSSGFCKVDIQKWWSNAMKHHLLEIDKLFRKNHTINNMNNAIWALFSGFKIVVTIPAGSLSKAALVRANSVNGPALFNVLTKSPASTAATKVVWSGELMAISTTSFDCPNDSAEMVKAANAGNKFFIKCYLVF